ncbi:MAG TPA: hypothetical protein EYN21_03310 [Candidatus Marinimicrobia bacterium]|nr:hypothetical protein [Candidatus Neomarinimicrobiota bacterium]
MIKQITSSIWILFLLMVLAGLNAQDAGEKELEEVTKLFRNDEPLLVKMSYSIKNVKRNTNDSTFIDTKLSYLDDESEWKGIPVAIRSRGNFRRKTCFYTPIKIEIKKSDAKKTLFKGNKKLKLVLPCLKERENNDNVLQEYLAYKLYEVISPYHFKTRLLNLDFEEIRGRKTKSHQLKAFLIEDDNRVAKRNGGKVVESFVHPLAMDPLASVQNAFFQFMIGNTDFSVAYQHNGKLLYADFKIIPLPYDFDMSGLVDASYAVANEKLNISYVTERKYRGFERDQKVFDEVRNQFLGSKDKMLAVVNGLEDDFDDRREFSKARNYILNFFDILENDAQYKSYIANQARGK